jgi:hypothetical protein
VFKGSEQIGKHWLVIGRMAIHSFVLFIRPAPCPSSKRFSYWSRPYSK